MAAGPTDSSKAVHSIGEGVNAQFGSKIEVAYPEINDQPFSVVRFVPARPTSVNVDVIVNYDLFVQIDAEGFTVFEKSFSANPSQLPGEVEAQIFYLAESGLQLVRRWPLFGKLSPFLVGAPKAELMQPTRKWRYARMATVWSPW